MFYAQNFFHICLPMIGYQKINVHDHETLVKAERAISLWIENMNHMVDGW